MVVCGAQKLNEIRSAGKTLCWRLVERPNPQFCGPYKASEQRFLETWLFRRSARSWPGLLLQPFLPSGAGIAIWRGRGPALPAFRKELASSSTHPCTLRYIYCSQESVLQSKDFPEWGKIRRFGRTTASRWSQEGGNRRYKINGNENGLLAAGVGLFKIFSLFSMGF